MTEERITSATGGQKGRKSARLGGADPQALMELAEVYGMGEGKYARYNYLLGYQWSLSVDALFRHLLAFLDGEDTDPESGLLHTAHVAWHALTLTSFQKRGLGTDDRAFPPEQPSVPLFDMPWKQRVGMGHPHAGMGDVLCYEKHPMSCDHGVSWFYPCEHCSLEDEHVP